MLSCYCCVCQESFNLLALSTYPVLLCFLHSLLNSLVCFLVFFCTFCFIPLFLQISPLTTEVENISGDPRLFHVMLLPKYLTGCISHCCIVGGNHGIDVHVLISLSNEWCKYLISQLSLLEKCKPHLGPSTSQDQILVLAGLAFLPSSDELERSPSPGHGHFLCLLQEIS